MLEVSINSLPPSSPTSSIYYQRVGGGEGQWPEGECCRRLGQEDVRGEKEGERGEKWKNEGRRNLSGIEAPLSLSLSASLVCKFEMQRWQVGSIAKFTLKGPTFKTDEGSSRLQSFKVQWLPAGSNFRQVLIDQNKLSI